MSLAGDLQTNCAFDLGRLVALEAKTFGAP